MTKNDSIELDAWLQKLGNEKPKDVLGGLERVRSVAKRMGVLPPAKRNIVVGGTNGKGSVISFLFCISHPFSSLDHIVFFISSSKMPHLNQPAEKIQPLI